MELRAVVERDVEAVPCEATLAEAVARLRTRGHRPLPVYAGGRVVGLLDGPPSRIAWRRATSTCGPPACMTSACRSWSVAGRTRIRRMPWP